MQTLKFEPDSEVVAQFIRDQAYPHQQWIEVEGLLHEHTLAAHVLDGDRKVGMIWLEWASPTEMAIHAGVYPNNHVDWIAIHPQLLAVTTFLGATELVLCFENSPRPLALGRLVTRLGFVPEPDNRFGLTHFYRRKTYV